MIAAPAPRTSSETAPIPALGHEDFQSLWHYMNLVAADLKEYGRSLRLSRQLDQDDLARPWTQRVVEEYCRRNGCKQLRIGTPVEVGERWFAVKIV